MAGHSQFKNIMHKKGKQDAIRSKVFSKLAREITVAAKMGMPDPNMNPRLRAAVNAAKAQSMPKDNIQRAIDKASKGDGENYEEVRYEGYGPGGVAIGRLEPRAGRLSGETPQGLFLVHAYDGIIVAGHAGVRLVGGAVRQDLRVGRRHVRMRADHEGDAAVEEMPDGLLLAGRFGMDVEDGGVAAVAHRAGADFPLYGSERIIERVHEGAPHDVADEHAMAVGALVEPGAAAGRARRVVDRADHPLLPLDEDERLALVEGVVAEGHAIGALSEKIVADRLGYAEAAGGVLAVDDHEVEFPAPPHVRQMCGDRRPSAASDHVADEKQSHVVKSLIALSIV